MDISTHDVLITEYEIPPINTEPSKSYLLCKRSTDLVCSLIALILLVLPGLLIAAAIKLDSAGPVLFKQERLGLQGKPFSIYKFRTMYIDAEKGGPQWAKENDSRCTRVGSALRKFRLDEIPQFWNILIGEMSLVGPRPERAFFYAEFEKYIHGFSNRLAVKPGLTGLAQVNGGYDLKPEEKIIYDMEYIEKQSIGLDLKCIAKTFVIVFRHKGAH